MHNAFADDQRINISEKNNEICLLARGFVSVYQQLGSAPFSIFLSSPKLPGPTKPNAAHRSLRSVDTETESDDEEERGIIPSSLKDFVKKGTSKVSDWYLMRKYQSWQKAGKTDDDIYKLWVRQGKDTDQIYTRWIRLGKSEEQVSKLFVKHGLDPEDLYGILTRQGKSMDDIYSLWQKVDLHDAQIYNIWLTTGKTDDQIFSAWYKANKDPENIGIMLQLGKNPKDNRNFPFWEKYSEFYRAKRFPDLQLMVSRT
ncbi:hypothetical protein V7S43_016443 [Phytophthora oleae]|uniref:RxLR effector protein n=1 Tax=Phytophthora oleae TaxID=2107226 RepID=A0ABD3EWN3_9STRA